MAEALLQTPNPILLKSLDQIHLGATVCSVISFTAMETRKLPGITGMYFVFHLKGQDVMGRHDPARTRARQEEEKP